MYIKILGDREIEMIYVKLIFKLKYMFFNILDLFGLMMVVK